MAYEITSDSELKDAVRDDTSYEDTPDELDSTQLDGVLSNAKRRVYLETGSDNWYSDTGLGHALFAYTCMRAKAAMENATIVSYSLGDQDVEIREADPETSQQIQQWADDVAVGLDASDLDESSGPTMSNTSGYIGETYYGDDS